MADGTGRDVNGCLHTSMTRRGAVAEFEKASRVSVMIKFPRRNRDLVSILVELEPVADLINRKTSPISPDEPFSQVMIPGIMKPVGRLPIYCVPKGMLRSYPHRLLSKATRI